MTPQEFLTKWEHVELKERTASQSHFNDLCRLLEIKDPIAADPKGEWFTFEKGATKTSGGEGWADVWRKGCFAWEYKGKRANLDKAFDQLLRYSIALESPPLLIVSDMERIRIHTNWTNTVQQVHEIALHDLADAGKRDLLKACFTDPERLRPTKTRQMMTEEAAKEFAALAQRLRDRGHDAHVVAHFVIRLVFCMFAEDVDLLPNKMFQRLLEASQANPDHFTDHAQTLFKAMKTGGMVGFEKVEWFNGGLFDDDSVLPLEKDDVTNLLTASKLFWDEIDPSILGTLFERGLDPKKRSQLGAHYTDRDKIVTIVEPVVIEPLEGEWSVAKERIADLIENAPVQTADKLLRGSALAARTKALKEAEAVHQAFVDRLKNFRVLDPACGSGNFLNICLTSLKDLEHKINLEAEQFGLPRGFPKVGPENVLGIEINPYAAELARVSVWIGEIQWMRRNGFNASRNPVLRSLDNVRNIDALINDDGDQIAWPQADVIIGNPPFLGSRKMKPELKSDYVDKLRSAYRKTVPTGADFVCFWFAKAWEAIEAGRTERAGLISTSSISGGASRLVLKPIADAKAMFAVWRDQPWVVDGAAVEVSLICFGRDAATNPTINGEPVDAIFADLHGAGEAKADLVAAKRLAENVGAAFQGIVPRGSVGKKLASQLGLAPASFVASSEQARNLFSQPTNPNGRHNREVVIPYLTGDDVTGRSLGRYIVDFFGLDEAEAALFEGPFAHVHSVKSHRSQMSQPEALETWWRHWRERSDMRSAIAPLPRFIVTPRVSKHRLFVWRQGPASVDNALIAIARPDDFTFGILHSRHHRLWSLRMGTRLENRPRYTPTTTFATFPFPAGMTPATPMIEYADDPRAEAVAKAARELNSQRENWLNPPELTTDAKPFDHLPVQKMPINDAAKAELKKRTLTKLYNDPPPWLTNAHKALDDAVSDAYGWPRDLTDDEAVQRLLQANIARAEDKTQVGPDEDSGGANDDYAIQG